VTSCIGSTSTCPVSSAFSRDRKKSARHSRRSRFCRGKKGLQRLLEYDAANKAQLVPTLRCVLDEQGNLRRAAGRLFVHYKTVQYRMARIRELTGWDLSRPELRLAIEVQLRWLDLHSDRAE